MKEIEIREPVTGKIPVDVSVVTVDPAACGIMEINSRMQKKTWREIEKTIVLLNFDMVTVAVI